MKITGKGTIYKNNYGYLITDNQKNMDGTYTNYYVSVKFQKGIEIPEEKSFVSVEGFTKPYKTKDGIDKMSYFITSCEVISKRESANNAQYQDVAKEEKNVYLEDIQYDEDQLENSLPF